LTRAKPLSIFNLLLAITDLMVAQLVAIRFSETIYH
jgi:hypothetical protein